MFGVKPQESYGRGGRGGGTGSGEESGATNQAHWNQPGLRISYRWRSDPILMTLFIKVFLQHKCSFVEKIYKVKGVLIHMPISGAHNFVEFN